MLNQLSIGILEDLIDEILKGSPLYDDLAPVERQRLIRHLRKYFVDEMDMPPISRILEPSTRPIEKM